MNAKYLAVTILGALALSACGDSNDDGSTTPPTLTTASAINTYLDGKTFLMAGTNIPSHPNGFSENVNFGASTQCYHSSQIAIAAGTWTVTSELGTLTGAATFGSTGTCDRNTPLGNPLTFTSTNILIENVSGNGACFDVTATYTGFAQEGRGSFSADGKTMTLELFFAGQATGHRCASGAVGSSTVTLNSVAFTGNAKQVYVLQ